MSFSMYDGVMLAIVLFAAFQGAMRGMAWQLAPIASLVMGYMVGVPLSNATAKWFGEPPLNHVFSLITMYLLVSLGVYLIARSLRESIENMKLLEFDRHLGALLGAVKGVLFTVVLTVALLTVSPMAASFITQSESRTIASQIVNYVCPLLPADIHQVIDPYLKPLHDHADDERMSVVTDRDPFDDQDVTEREREPVAPRPRRNQAIFEDEPLDSPDPVMDNSTDVFTERPTRRQPAGEPDDFDDIPRRRPSIDDLDTNTTAPVDDFGSDPNQDDLAEDPRPRVR